MAAKARAAAKQRQQLLRVDTELRQRIAAMLAAAERAQEKGQRSFTCDVGAFFSFIERTEARIRERL